MKTNKHKQVFHLFLIFIALFFLSACSQTKNADGSNTPIGLDTSISNNHWRFNPTSAMPQKGSSRMVDASYFVSLVGDSLSVYLPYYGTNYGSSDIMSGKNPLDFNTNKIVLSKSRGKNNAWEIQVQPKGEGTVDLMDFKFYTNGTASLYIRFVSRSSISYNGTVQAINNKK